MDGNDPERRFRENYPGVLIAIGLFSMGHLVYQLVTGQASVGQIGGGRSPMSRPRSSFVSCWW